MNKSPLAQTKKNLLESFSQKKESNFPIWLMRQAGRYLPEYKEIRKLTDNFLTCCYTKELVTEITLQPIKRFSFDAAIIFSDILVIPDSLGLKVEFEENLGPKIEKLDSLNRLNKLEFNKKHLQPVYDAIKDVREKLDVEKTLIGFAGAPWTLAAYILEGKGSKQFHEAKKWAYNNKYGFKQLIKILEDAVSDHLIEQIKSGCEVVQIFDSWAGMLNEDEVFNWSIRPIKNIIEKVKTFNPNIPVIVFPRGVGIFYPQYNSHTAADGISVDQNIPLEWIAEQTNCLLQGNLDPIILALDLEAAIIKTKQILDAMKGHNFIFNLGHGILPYTPIDNVEALVNCVRNYEK